MSIKEDNLYVFYSMSCLIILAKKSAFIIYQHKKTPLEGETNQTYFSTKKINIAPS